jgi:hypothetical protein
MSFDVNIKGSDNLPVPTTADPETHGDRIAAKAEYDEAVRDIVQDAVDAIGKLDATASVVATGTVGEIGPISLVHTPSEAETRRADRESKREAKAKGTEQQELTKDEAGVAAVRNTEAVKRHPPEDDAPKGSAPRVEQGTLTTKSR